LNTEVEVPGLGLNTAGGDDWNDFYFDTPYASEGF
jgi:hypothetical protein